MAAVTVEAGQWTTIFRKKKASTAFAKNSLVMLEDGFVAPADANTGASDKKALGVYEGSAIAASSTTTDLIAVRVPSSGDALIRATVTGTLASTNEGDSFDMSDSQTVNAASSTNDAVRCVRFASATEGVFAISAPVNSK